VRLNVGRTNDVTDTSMCCRVIGTLCSGVSGLIPRPQKSAFLRIIVALRSISGKYRINAANFLSAASLNILPINCLIFILVSDSVDTELLI